MECATGQGRAGGRADGTVQSVAGGQESEGSMTGDASGTGPTMPRSKSLYVLTKAKRHRCCNLCSSHFYLFRIVQLIVLPCLQTTAHTRYSWYIWGFRVCYYVQTRGYLPPSNFLACGCTSPPYPLLIFTPVMGLPTGAAFPYVKAVVENARETSR